MLTVQLWLWRNFRIRRDPGTTYPPNGVGRLSSTYVKPPGWRDWRTRSSAQLTLVRDILSIVLVHNISQVNALENQLFHWN